MHNVVDALMFMLFWGTIAAGFFLGLWSGFTIVLKANKYEKKSKDEEVRYNHKEPITPAPQPRLNDGDERFLLNLRRQISRTTKSRVQIAMIDVHLKNRGKNEAN